MLTPIYYLAAAKYEVSEPIHAGRVTGFGHAKPGTDLQGDATRAGIAAMLQTIVATRKQVAPGAVRLRSLTILWLPSLGFDSIPPVPIPKRGTS